MRTTLVAALIGVVSSIAAAVNTTTFNATTTDLVCFPNGTITQVVTSFVPLTLTVTVTKSATETNVFSYDVVNGTTSWVGNVSPTQSALTLTETSTVEVTAVPASLIQSIVITITETSVTTETETIFASASSAVGTDSSDDDITVWETGTVWVTVFSASASSAVGTDFSDDVTTTLTIYDTVTSTRAVAYASHISVSNSSVLSATSTEEVETTVVTETQTQQEQVNFTATVTDLNSSLSTSVSWTNATTTFVATDHSTATSDVSSATPCDGGDATSTGSVVSTSTVNVSGIFPQLTVFRSRIVALSSANASSTGQPTANLNATSVDGGKGASASLFPCTNFTSLTSASLGSASKTFHLFGNKSTLPVHTPVKSLSAQSTIGNASATVSSTRFNIISVATNFSAASTHATFLPSSAHSSVSSNTTTVVSSVDQAHTTTLVPVYGAPPNTTA